MKYVFKVNEKEKFSLSEDDLAISDLVEVSAKQVHILKNKKGYNVKLNSKSLGKKTVTLDYKGTKYNVAIQDSVDQMVESMGLTITSEKSIGDILAPMPGKVLDIAVEIGDQIDKGSHIITLEAMKMENILKAPAPGIVTDILIKKGATVDKGQLLIKFD